MQPLTASVAEETEDIEAVLGRFQAWTKNQKAADKTRHMIDGIRELSYEEALQSSRRRWQSHDALPCPPENDRATTPPMSHNHSKPDRISISATKPSENIPVTAGASLPRSFGSVLSETVPPEISSGPLALVWPAAGRSERQVSMSFRVAASEQALIKARAAEAGLSVSAYLRQCALEVEKLRAQVHHALTLMEQSKNTVASLHAGPPAALPSAGGFIARLRHLLFGSQDRLALRA